jgi:hypothetical protein
MAFEAHLILRMIPIPQLEPRKAEAPNAAVYTKMEK